MKKTPLTSVGGHVQGSFLVYKPILPAVSGPSSNIAFTRNIRRAIAGAIRNAQPGHSNNLQTEGTAFPRRQLAVSRPHSPTSLAVGVSWFSETAGDSTEAFRIPPEHETTRLMRHFFSDTGTLFPYVHETTFWNTYTAVRESRFRRVRQSWLGLLNMIMAMATSTGANPGTSSAERAAQSDIFFSRSKNLCFGQFIAAANIETVQAMLLMTQYLQGTRYSRITWAIHGHAVQAALQLGLHSEETLKRFEPLEREIRVRTWHACVALDRWASHLPVRINWTCKT